MNCKPFVVLILLVVFSMVLGACGAAPVPVSQNGGTPSGEAFSENSAPVKDAKCVGPTHTDQGALWLCDEQLKMQIVVALPGLSQATALIDQTGRLLLYWGLNQAQLSYTPIEANTQPIGWVVPWTVVTDQLGVLVGGAVEADPAGPGPKDAVKNWASIGAAAAVAAAIWIEKGECVAQAFIRRDKTGSGWFTLGPQLRAPTSGGYCNEEVILKLMEDVERMNIHPAIKILIAIALGAVGEIL